MACTQIISPASRKLIIPVVAGTCLDRSQSHGFTHGSDTHPFNWLGAVVVNARQCKTGKVSDQLHIFLFIKLNVQAHTCILVNFFLYSHQNATNSLKIWGSQNTSVKLSLDLFTVILMVVVEQLNLHFGYSVRLLVHILPQGKP